MSVLFWLLLYTQYAQRIQVWEVVIRPYKRSTEPQGCRGGLYSKQSARMQSRNQITRYGYVTFIPMANYYPVYWTYTDKKATALLKVIYLEMFGYDMSWASFHVLEVMSSTKYLQKRVGYLGAMQSFRSDTEVLMLATNLLKKVAIYRFP